MGRATITKNNDGTVTLGVDGANNGDLPDGYRVLGWYDENGYRLYRGENYTLSLNDLDLTEPHTFTVRLEYRVRYYTRAFNQDGEFTGANLYKTSWMHYNEPFENIGAPGFKEEYITHWGTSFVDHGHTNNENDAFSGNINTPIDVYSHNYTSAIINGYQVSAYTDFPGSGTINDLGLNTGVKFKYEPISNRYHFKFWTLNSSYNNDSWVYTSNPVEISALGTTRNYQAMAMVTTDIVFHKKDDSLISVTRRYNSNILMDNNTVYTYYYPFYNTSSVVSTNASDGGTISNTLTMEASPTTTIMDESDYYFVGWISSSDVQVGSSEWNYIYDVANDSYTSSKIDKVLPYIVDNTMLVDETLDLYPVYVKYNIETTTSLSSITSPDVLVPTDPTYTLIKTVNGYGEVTIVPDEDTYIVTGDDDKYVLDYLTVSVDNGDEIIVNKDNNGEYKYVVRAGSTYLFTAHYIPYILVYHIDINNLDTKVYNKNDQVGEQPIPEFSVNDNYLFVGWSKDTPSSNYHLFNDYSSYESAGLSIITSSMLVTDSYELYPVYVRNNITVNSNIDNYLDNNEIARSSVYTLKKQIIDTMNLNIKMYNVNNYVFIGWYENYIDNNNIGDLVTTELNYPLNVQDNFNNKVYTAVYREVYQLRYHDLRVNSKINVTTSILRYNY